MNTKRSAFRSMSFACCAVAIMSPQWLVAAEGEQSKSAVAALKEEDQAALECGRKVLALQRAIAHPQAPDSLEAVKALGLDSRYYVMVRGWLGEQLRADSGISDASKERTPQLIKDRIAFLKKAIRAIDLER